MPWNSASQVAVVGGRRRLLWRSSGCLLRKGRRWSSVALWTRPRPRGLRGATRERRGSAGLLLRACTHAEPPELDVSMPARYMLDSYPLQPPVQLVRLPAPRNTQSIKLPDRSGASRHAILDATRRVRGASSVLTAAAPSQGGRRSARSGPLRVCGADRGLRGRRWALRGGSAAPRA